MSKTYKWEFSSRTQAPDSRLMLWLYKQFVLNCPVQKVSNRGKEFSSLGWRKSGFLTLIKEMKSQSGLEKRSWKWVDDDELHSALRDLSVSDSYTLDGEFFVYSKGQKQMVEGLFYMIRNALAHGSFRYHNTKYGEYLALQTSNKEKLRGRAVVKIETLERWRSLLNHSEKYLPK